MIAPAVREALEQLLGPDVAFDAPMKVKPSPWESCLKAGMPWPNEPLSPPSFAVRLCATKGRSERRRMAPGRFSPKRVATASRISTWVDGWSSMMTSTGSATPC